MKAFNTEYNIKITKRELAQCKTPKERLDMCIEINQYYSDYRTLQINPFISHSLTHQRHYLDWLQGEITRLQFHIKEGWYHLNN